MLTIPIWMYVVAAFVTASPIGWLSAWLFCGAAKINLVQQDEQEKMFDPMAPRGMSNETYSDSTWALDESLSDCETVISRTVVRV